MMKITIKITALLFILTTVFASAYGQQKDQAEERKYVKVEVDGLACPFCAYGLEKKLKNLDGAENLQINIQAGYALLNVPASNVPSEEKLKKIVADAGFEARKISFSDEPFEGPEENENK